MHTISMSMARSSTTVSCNSLSPPPSSATPRRFQPLLFNPISHFPKPHSIRLFTGFRRLINDPNSKQQCLTQSGTNATRSLVVYCLPSVDQPPFEVQGWLFGLLIPVALSFFTNKWGPLLKWTKNVEEAVQTAENVAEAVEDIAGKVDKLAEDIGADLPEGKLKNAFSLLEHAAEEISEDASKIDDLIDKVQAVEEKVEALIEEGNKVVTEAKAQKQI